MVSLFGSEWVSWLPPPNHEEGFSAVTRLPKQLAPEKPVGNWEMNFRLRRPLCSKSCTASRHRLAIAERLFRFRATACRLSEQLLLNFRWLV